MSPSMPSAALRVGIAPADFPEAETFDRALSNLCADVEVTLEHVRIRPLDPKHADITAWFHRPSEVVSEGLLDTLAAFIEGGGTVIPVIPTGQMANTLPGALRHLNTFDQDRFGSAWPFALADWVFSESLLRRRRRVFISYRRDDSQAIANQLYDALTRQQWHVFLDNRSIDSGDNFQKDLHWELHDSDVLLLLASPRFQHSRWAMEEIGSAGLERIGILAINWPEAYLGATGSYGGEQGLSRSGLIDHIGSDRRLDLDVVDLCGTAAHPSHQLLTEPALEQLYQHLYTERVPAQLDRLSNYVRLSRRALRRSYQARDFETLRYAGDYSCPLELEGELRQTFVRVLPFRPSPAELYTLHHQVPNEYNAVACIYPEINPEHPLAAGLRWLMHTSRQHGDQNRIYRLWHARGSTLQ